MTARPRACLVCVGSELLAGRVNTHQAWLSARLASAGFKVVGASSAPDEVALIATALRRALDAAEAVVVCGGLGPTFDDLTREAAAAALGRRLRFDRALWSRILKRFARCRFSMIPAENKRQARMITGAEVLVNRAGSAPGQRLEFLGRDGRPRSLILLPGPYAEMAPIFKRVLPRLAARHRAPLAASLCLRLVGVPESTADERLLAVRARFPDARFTILASEGEVSFHATLLQHSAARLKGEIAALRRDARGAVGRWVYGEGEATLEGALGARLKKRRLTLAVAESCTGGSLGGRITAAPGSSAWFAGGVIAYANSVKIRLLGVSPRLIKRHGAVSAECASAMAAGARRITGARIGIGVTGVAGPGGGTKEKPVGLVFVAVSGPAVDRVARHEFIGPRETVRARAAAAALALLKEVLDASVEVS